MQQAGTGALRHSYVRLVWNRLGAIVATALCVAVMTAILVKFPLIPNMIPEDVLKLETAEFCLASKDAALHAPEPCKTWQEVSLPHQVYVPASADVTHALYRLHFEVTEDTTVQSIFIRRFGDTIFLRLNGAGMVPDRRRDVERWHDWLRPAYINIPPAMLNDGRNTVEVDLSGDPGTWLYLYPAFVGDAATLDRAWFKNFLARNGFVRMAVFISLVQFVVFALMLRSGSWRKMGAGWLPFLMLSVAIYTFQWSTPNLAPNGPFWHILCVLSIQASVYFLYRFLHVFVHGYPPEGLLFIHILLGFELFILVIAAILFQSNLLPYTHVVTGCLALYSLAMLLAGPRSLDLRVRLQLYPLLTAALAFAATQWLLYAIGPTRVETTLGTLAPMLIFVAISWAFLERMLSLQTKTDELNASLLDQVAEKAQELEQIYVALARHAEVRILQEERQRIMLDLHDGVGGQLVNTLAYLETSQRDDPVLVAALEDALADMGLMIDSLQNGDDLAVMIAMLRRRLDPLLRRHNARFDWKVEGRPHIEKAGPSGALSVLRIIQESITNALKHAKASVIVIEATDRSVTISDNGQGFDPDEPALGGVSGSGLGISSMRSRATEIGIDLRIESSEEGTRVDLRW